VSGDFSKPGLAERVRLALERVRAWAARRPEAIVQRQPAWTWATNGAIVGATGGAAVLVLVAGVALGPLVGGSAPAPTGATGSPSPIAAVSGSASPGPAMPGTTDSALWRSDQSLTPSPTAAAIPTRSPGSSLATLGAGWYPSQVATPSLLATVDCPDGGGSDMWYGIGGGRLYYICGRDVKAVSLSTNQVVATYSSVFRPNPCLTAPANGGACTMWMDSIAATEWLWTSQEDFTIPSEIDPAVKQIDPKTKKVVDTYDGWLVGSGLGSVLISNDLSGDPFNPEISTDIVDGSTGEYLGTISGDGGLWSGCDSFWQVNRVEFEPAFELTRFSSTGEELWSDNSLQGYVGALGQAGSECWAVINRTMSNDPAGQQLARLGSAGVDLVKSAPASAASIWIEGGTMWVETSSGAPFGSSLLQQLDPNSYRPIGQAWVIPHQAAEYGIVVGSGSVWIAYGTQLERYAISIATTPARAMSAPTATPTSAPSESLAPTGTLSEEPSADPSA
jgi:hypothetical protein